MGIPVREEFLYTLSFADDQVVIAQDDEDLGFMLRKLMEEYTKAGLEINFQKTEYLTTTEEPIQNLEVDDNIHIRGTDKFKYLGYTLSKKGTSEEEITSRLGQARMVIRQLHPILWDRHITRETKTLIYKVLVQSIMTYGAENWVINKKNQNKILAVEMEYWRRCCGITRLDRVRNEEIRRQMGVETNILQYIETKRLIWYGHVRRSDNSRWIKRISDWSPPGRRKRGRPRRSWRDEVDESMERRGLEEGEWENRDEWRLWLSEGRQRQL